MTTQSPPIHPRDSFISLTTTPDLELPGEFTDNSYKDDAYTRWVMFDAYDFQMGSTPATARLILNNLTDGYYYTLRSCWSSMLSEPSNVVDSLSVSFRCAAVRSA
ncbi:hypothetical protein [Microbulbifer litoralis]|uniref:hypothetical protein n=1 Tax=Microbulbifer litoralis TaxID=2933965 RepID=UPI0020287645|nr:hypothetical protein [Microbulbifer sp. GX H0434]